MQAPEVPKGRSSSDVGGWTVASRAEHDNEMDKPGLHRTSILLTACALITNPSMFPKDFKKSRETAVEPTLPPSPVSEIGTCAQDFVTTRDPLPKSRPLAKKL